ncbi:MAG TPA: hypothetical protein VLI90_00680, partial [Tepidisphaeraceae bacterium]|nr:hypothetical protein [Tepidisphaeraceae bacterium]
TVQAPQDDYFPNADPATYNSGPNPPPITDFPIPVANGTSAANYGEDAIPLHGLININTASWKVLSMLPLVRATNGSVDRVNTDKLARAIVYFRDVDDGSVAGTPHPHGPFKSIFELNQVVDVAGAAPPPVPPGFQNGYNNIDTRYTGRPDDPDGRQGDLVPNDLRPGGAPYPTYATAAPYSPTDGVSGDFKEKFLAMTRISNLITTRSDSFTCYVLVQGWRGVGTPGAALAVQKRAAFILDRSNVGYTLDQSSGQRRLNTLPNVERVPTN